MRSILISMSIIFVSFASSLTGANASQYAEAITGCKSAIQQEVGDVDGLSTVLKKVKSKARYKVQLNFRVRYTDDTGKAIKSNAKCLAKQSGEVLTLDVT